jgi:hypothetical protein
VAPGTLVLTEVRGSQSGPDTWGQWIELYNASAAEVPLAGAKVVFTKLDGSDTAAIVLRDPALTVAPGGYVVLGRFPAGQEPAHVDYGWSDEAQADLPDGALLQIVGCGGQVIDQVVYRDLPAQGSFGFMGMPPDADATDVETDWCIDAVDDGPTTELGIPGTPGEGNRCG